MDFVIFVVSSITHKTQPTLFSIVWTVCTLKCYRKIYNKINVYVSNI